MRVLGIDTATWTAAVGVTEDGRAVSERIADARRSHVGHLPKLVEAALSDAAIALEAIDAIAVSAGPGSFTGLRIGVAFAKGLAFAGGVPLVGVPTLEAHASCANQPAGTSVCIVNDARKGEVYAAVFVVQADGGIERRSPDRAWVVGDLLVALPPDAAIFGDACGLLEEAISAGARRRSCHALTPSGAVVARLGTAALARGERDRVGDFEPTYVRAPDATLPTPPLR